jgi:hypothetical protein
MWLRLSISKGLEIHVTDSHPLARLNKRGADVAGVIRKAISQAFEELQGADSPKGFEQQKDPHANLP